MEVNDLAKVGMVGCGTMGPGVVAAIANAGWEVIVRLKGIERFQDSQAQIASAVSGLAKRGKLKTDSQPSLIKKVTFTTSYADLAGCGLILDATQDTMAGKTEVIAQLDAVCASDTIYGFLTSLMSISALAARSSNPARVVGMHFCIPAHLVDLVEVARGMSTGSETFRFAMNFVARMGKRAIACRDSPGLILNYFLFPMFNLAFRALENGLTSIEELDTALKIGLGHSMGPLELADMAGLEHMKECFELLFAEVKESRYAVSPLLTKMVESGLWGVKSGRGFYLYDQAGKRVGPNKEIEKFLGRRDENIELAGTM